MAGRQCETLGPRHERVNQATIPPLMSPFTLAPSRRSSALSVLLLTAGFLVPGQGMLAQGVTVAVVEGVVVNSSGAAVEALVVLRHPGTGAEYRVITQGSGRFRLEVVPNPGPYLLEARVLGKALVVLEGLRLEAGDRIYRRLVLGDAQQVVLPEVEVRSPPIPASGGPDYVIPGEGVRNLPLLNRDFVGLFATVPQALGRGLNSIGGQHPAYNAIRIDGGIGNDVYGVGRTPGSAAGAKSISLEAIEGIRVLIAPFDVRQGGFAGALINAVTRSGTNRLEGSVFTSFQRSFLVGRDAAGRAVATFDKTQYGVTLGGPIRRDLLHFFLAADLQHSATPFAGPEAGAPGTGISEATARRAREVFRNVYGFDPGGPEPPVIQQPDRDLFAKLAWIAGPGRRVEISHNWVEARSDAFNRDVRNQVNRDGWQLSGSGEKRNAKIHATRLQASVVGHRWSHELVAAYQTIDEALGANLSVPLFLVQDQPRTYLAGGSTVTGQGTILDQRLLEVTDNVTWTAGPHTVTAGASAQLLHFTDNLFLNAWGVWRFPSVDALEQLAPDRYEVNLPLREGGPIAKFNARVFAGYVQDRTRLGERLTATGGIRIEAPFVDAPRTNPALAASDTLGRIDTGATLLGRASLAPRLGLMYDVSGGWRTVLRGGIGGFTAQTPFVWLGGAFSNTGLDQETLICEAADGVPAPVTDTAQRPDRCLRSAGRPRTVPSVVAFSPAFSFPQAVKVLVGVDHAFGSSVTGSVDLILSRSRHAAYVTDVNLEPVGVTSEGRVIYGTVSSGGTAAPHRKDPVFGQVLRFDDRSGDREVAAILSLSKVWRSGGYVQLGYQWSRAQDRFSLVRPAAMLTFRETPIDGSLAERNRTRSGFDAPHSLTASGVLPLWGGLTVGFLGRYQSGRPFAYGVDGDANADGINVNDLFYVPRWATDISLTNPAQFADLNRFIESEPCLRRQRGRIMARNSCRNPAFATLDARLAEAVSLGGRRVEVALDFFNVLNFLDGDWGRIREATAREYKGGLVRVSGWDPAAGRPVYSLPIDGGQVVLPVRNQVLIDPSRWRLQLGARLRY
jgi:hypothetical protein